MKKKPDITAAVLENANPDEILKYCRKLDTGIEFIKADLKRMEKKLDELSKPDFIIKLIDKGCLNMDGRTPAHSLNETAAALFEITKKPFNWMFLQKTFISSTGEKYSKTACKAAINYVNAS